MSRILLVAVLAAVAAASSATAAVLPVAPVRAPGAVLAAPATAASVTVPRLAAYTKLAYASYCIEGLSDWGCFWCKEAGTPAVQVLSQFKNDGVWGAWGYVGLADDDDAAAAAAAASELTNTSAKMVVVSFRGSTTVKNWETDLDWLPTKYPDAPGAKVHRGFYESWTSVRSKVQTAVAAAVKAAKGEKVRVLVTGHSLGAALAQLAAVELVHAAIPAASVELFDFGQPRVGNREFADYAHGLVAGYRVINEHDPVPHVPLEIMGFHHPPQEVWFQNSTKEFRLCSATNGEDPSCSDQLGPVALAAGVEDHTEYLGINLHNGDTKGCPSQCIISGRC